jgi:hypothetical protein
MIVWRWVQRYTRELEHRMRRHLKSTTKRGGSMRPGTEPLRWDDEVKLGELKADALEIAQTLR